MQVTSRGVMDDLVIHRWRIDRNGKKRNPRRLTLRQRLEARKSYRRREQQD
jgi:hypothetical protein